MKITALIDDNLIAEIKELTGGRNITDAITIALKAYASQKKLDKAMKMIDQEPLQFQEDFTAYGIRKINRNR
ncbi:MAG: DUF2191 domain-containing protein [Cyclobacteriaceae bacterium]